ncbi:MAG: hypothetical protein IBX55_18855 [Methyloprofundus sp.]|nr:hypothetical protein [Methyloprofundus sp.]MBW6452604.1 hypothetical protein [Methyloprofundus sp.]
MNISPDSSAIQLFNSAQQKSTDAAVQIAKTPIQSNEVGSANFSQQDILKPILSLKEAELETSVGVKLLNAEQEMLGTLIDEKA